MEKQLISFFEHKRVLILGFGREGRSTYEFLTAHVPSATVVVADKNVCAPDGKDWPCETRFGDDYLCAVNDCDVIMKAPGIALKNDVSDDVKAKITSQTDLFLRFFEGKTVGVTGTKGKSTTSSLVHHILTHCGVKNELVGNIGVPVFSCLDRLTPDTVAVYELSCHQLEYVQASPTVGVLLNIYEDHLDHYASYEAYKEAKYNLFNHMKPSDTLIYGMGCEDVDYTRLTSGAWRTIAVDPARAGYVESKLIGRHNLFNIECAMTACALLGCGEEDMEDAVRTFEPLEHRLEKVGTFDGVTYYNDSISTIPEATVTAVTSLGNVHTLLVGGMDRGIDYEGLVSFLCGANVPCVVCMYASGKRVYDRLREVGYKNELHYVNDLESAVKMAKTVTKQGSVLLSPAAASYDSFKNFEERGTRFKALVKGENK